MRNFIAEGNFLGTFADRAVSGAAKNIHSSLGCGYYCSETVYGEKTAKRSCVKKRLWTRLV